MDLNNTEDKEMQKGRKLVRLGGILVIVALLGLIVLSFSSCNSKTEQMQAQIDSLKLVNDQLQLAGEYEQLNTEFQQYENQAQYLQNDSLIEKYAEAKDKVEKLLVELKTQKITSGKRIKELQDEISTLKKLMRHYVAVIDSLGKENAGLKAENKEIKEKNRQLVSQVSSVSEKNQVLSQRMELAEKLNLTGLRFTPVNKRGKTEKRIGKAKQLIVSFTIPQNNSTPVGEKTFYVRIVSPEGNVLGNGATFSFEGGNVVYTERKTIEYDQQEVSLTVYHNVNTVLSKGNYTVEVFVDNYRLISRSFMMEK
mgnify:CR=1 FL=1